VNALERHCANQDLTIEKLNGMVQKDLPSLINKTKDKVIDKIEKMLVDVEK